MIELFIILAVVAFFGYVVGVLVEHQRASDPEHYR